MVLKKSKKRRGGSRSLRTPGYPVPITSRSEIRNGVTYGTIRDESTGETTRYFTTLTGCQRIHLYLEYYLSTKFHLKYLKSYASEYEIKNYKISLENLWKNIKGCVKQEYHADVKESLDSIVRRAFYRRFPSIKSRIHNITRKTHPDTNLVPLIVDKHFSWESIIKHWIKRNKMYLKDEDKDEYFVMVKTLQDSEIYLINERDQINGLMEKSVHHFKQLLDQLLTDITFSITTINSFILQLADKAQDGDLHEIYDRISETFSVLMAEVNDCLKTSNLNSLPDCVKIYWSKYIKERFKVVLLEWLGDEVIDIDTREIMDYVSTYIGGFMSGQISMERIFLFLNIEDDVIKESIFSNEISTEKTKLLKKFDYKIYRNIYDKYSRMIFDGEDLPETIKMAKKEFDEAYEKFDEAYEK